MDKKHVRRALLGIGMGLILFAILWTCVPKNEEAAEFTGAALPWIAIGCLLAVSVSAASMNRKQDE